MKTHFLTSTGKLSVALAVLSLAIAAACRAPRPPQTNWTPPRTADGQPDLRGVWNFSAVTPLERPGELRDKQSLTGEEAAEFEKRTVEARDPDRRSQDPETDLRPAYNKFWYEQGTKLTTRRTSLIVDPSDGRIPPLTPEGKKRADAVAETRRRLPAGPEDLSLGTRCILGFNSGPPMLPSAYNNNIQLFQTHDTVVILNEMVHNPRIVPLDGRPHDSMPQWVGDSRGSWKGDTLVVDTTNFMGGTSFPGSTSNLHLVERFRRVAPDALIYEFTVEDPTTWTRPWTVEVPMTKIKDPIYEYACHEGNRAMVGILAGSRAEERNVVERTTKRSPQ
jgi:hypothetical protein